MGAQALVFAVCCGLALALTPAARVLGRRLGRRVGPMGTCPAAPPVGGLVLIIATFLPVAVVHGAGWGGESVLRTRAICLVLGCAAVCAVGLVNDLRPLRGRYMLLGQVLAVGTVLASDLTVPAVRLVH